MITKQTLFILGAGASADFGYPLGAKLREEICDRLKTANRNAEEIGKVLAGEDSDIPEYLENYILEVTKFGKQLYEAGDYSK